MCTSELTAFVNPDGGRPIFGYQGIKEGLSEIKLPCGKCPECVKDYYQSWATRGSRELQKWETNVFVTLTYSDEKLPKNRSLDISHVQKFMKRLKKYYGSTKENPIRQIYTGEYGEDKKRPHYHAILFNCDFADKKRHGISASGNVLYTSEILDRLWGHGHVKFGYANAGAIGYLFKYILKKKTRKEKLQPLFIEYDGVTYEVEHEFCQSSRNPGIGACLRGSTSIHKGFLTNGGVKNKIPKYYLNWLKENEPKVYEIIQQRKMDHALLKKPETALRKKQKENAQRKLTSRKSSL